MDDFETPYDDSVEVRFIDCEICNKSIRGETLYKLHVTSPAHVQNEKILVAEGKIITQQNVPDFEDIMQYLEYINIDEPVIGLDYFVQVPDEGDDVTGIKYNCTLCNVYAYLTEAVQHVIGRKHRQKYLDKNRPDLATWENKTRISGKIIRAKAEVAERQDGRGTAKPLLNKTKKRHSFTRSSDQGGQNNGKGSSLRQDFGPPMAKIRSHPRGLGRHLSNSDYMQNMCGDSSAHDNRGSRSEREMFSHSYTEAGDCSEYQKKYVTDYEHERMEAFSDVPGLHDQDRRHYSGDFRKSHTQKDLLKEFYTEELRREQLAKARQWPHDNDYQQHENMRRVGREVEPEASQSSFSTSLDGKNPHEIVKLITDYRHYVASGHPDGAFANSGTRRVSPSRSGDIRRKMADVPDPFMRFLRGGTSHDESGVRKKRSRFSDATVEELQAAQNTFTNEYGPPDPKFPSLRPDIRERQPQQTDPPIGHEWTESYQRAPVSEHSESTGDVFEMLKNIEIENVEEATFLQEKLYSVLREFKARKSEKTAQTSQSKTVMVKEYNNLGPVAHYRTPDHYARIHGENLDIREAEAPYEDPRKNEGTMGEDFQEYQHPVFPETRRSNRNPYREEKRWPSSVFDKPVHFPEEYQESLHPRDYQSADDFLDHQSSRSDVPMERGPRMHRPPQYSRNLDKITSTLLELVARK